MRKTNFYIQVAMILLGALVGMACLVWNELMIYLLMVQFCVGFYQVASAVIMLSIEGFRRTHLIVYLVGVGGSLTAIGCFGTYPHNGLEAFFLVLLFGLPWLLALYFLFISFRFFKLSMS